MNKTLPPLIYNLDLPELITLMETLGEAGYRARQVWQGLYQNYWQSPDEFTALPIQLRQKLGEALRFEALKPLQTLESSDKQTKKTLFRLADGKQIEAVLMGYARRRTLCISTQVGCAMGCTFCATGQMGFKRHLSGGEIAAQEKPVQAAGGGRGERGLADTTLTGKYDQFLAFQESTRGLHQRSFTTGWRSAF